MAKSETGTEINRIDLMLLQHKKPKLAYTLYHYDHGGIVDRLDNVFCQSYVSFFSLCVFTFSISTSTYKWRMLPLADYDIILYNLCSMNIYSNQCFPQHT